MDTYSCDQCNWKYVWAMGDRVKAVKAHELAHLLGEVGESKGVANEVPEYLMADNVESHRGAQWS